MSPTTALRKSLAARSPSQHAGVSGIDIEWLFEGPIVRLNRWRCHETTTGVTSERQQHWRVIGFVHAGAYELRSPRGRALIDPTCVAFLGPKEPYQTSHPCGCGDHGTSLIVRDDVLNEIVARRRPDLADSIAGPFPDASGRCSSRASLLQRTLARSLGQGVPIDPVAVEELALSILSDVVESSFAPRRDTAPSGSARGRRELAETARHVLGRSFRQPVSLDSLARAVAASPFHLCRVFRNHTGLPVHRYLTRLRMHAALDALEAGETDLSGLAFDLGYSSHSHFTFAFRREFGCPPSRLRRPEFDPLRARIR